MEYQPPCRFPADDPHRLWILVAGRQLSYAEARRWFSVVQGSRKMLPLVAYALCLLYAMGTLFVATETGLSTAELAGVFAILLTAVVALSVAMLFLLLYPRRQARARFADYEADGKRHAESVRFAFYTDSLAVTTRRGTKTVKFSEVEQCVETYDGFLLTAETGYIILRSEDLTVYDLQLIREYLTERLPARVMCCKSPAQARLYQPLPIPRFEPESACLTTASLPLSSAEPYVRDRRARFYRVTAVIQPLMLIVGVMLALLFVAVPQFLANLAIFCGACLVGGAVGSIVLFWLFDRRHRGMLEIRFEPDGLRLMAEGAEHFLIKERVWLFTEDAGATLRFLNGETLFIPADAVENMAVLKALSGVE